VALAKDIVTQYHGASAADAAAAEFDRRFREKLDPEEIPAVAIPRSELNGGRIWVPKLLVRLKFASSTSDGRRLIVQGAVNVGPERVVISDPKADLELFDGMIVRVGSRRIARIRLV
jgi:tyrosyl-tRNA synthetase